MEGRRSVTIGLEWQVKRAMVLRQGNVAQVVLFQDYKITTSVIIPLYIQFRLRVRVLR
jgi:hypothetical protein